MILKLVPLILEIVKILNFVINQRVIFSLVSPFSIAITSLGEERANLRAFRTFVRFVRFVLVWICRFPLPLGIWEGLRFVFVTFPGIICYLFLKIMTDSRIRSVISKEPKYRFPAHIDFNKCRETIGSALNDYYKRWCKREHVESNK